jgi:hypothetical protein
MIAALAIRYRMDGVNLVETIVPELLHSVGKPEKSGRKRGRQWLNT